jgi:hypothetical protein
VQKLDPKCLAFTKKDNYFLASFIDELFVEVQGEDSSDNEVRGG